MIVIWFSNIDYRCYHHSVEGVIILSYVERKKRIKNKFNCISLCIKEDKEEGRRVYFQQRFVILLVVAVMTMMMRIIIRMNYLINID